MMGMLVLASKGAETSKFAAVRAPYAFQRGEPS
jgi:hypothetical protein